MRQMPAIDGKRLPGDVRRRGRCEKADDAGDFGRRPPAAERGALCQPAADRGVVDHLALRLGGEIAGRDRIDGDSARPEFGARKRVVQGKSVARRADLGGRRLSTKKNTKIKKT